MADSEIQILIKAVDEVSATTKKVEESVGKMSNEISKQTQKTNMSFEQQIGILISLGSAVASVDRIFSSYQNLQLRIENATMRLTDAQDRLRKAQYNLNKVMKDSTKTAEDVAEAQADVESASRSLTVAQNNLERAQNQAIGTYINIGLQLLNLAVAIPKIISAINIWRKSEEGLNIIRTIGLALTNPIILAIGLTAAAMGVLVVKEMMGTTETDNLSSAQINLKTNIDNSTGAINDQIDAISLLGEEVQKVINQNSIWVSAAETVQGKLIGIQKEITESEKREQILRAIGKEKEADAEAEITRKLRAEYVTIAKNFNTEVEKIAQEAFDAQMKRLSDLLKELTKVADKQAEVWGTGVSVGAIIGTTPGIITGKGTSMNLAPIWKPEKTDFISRPGQIPISFSPDDTIIGTKNGVGGINITITGNIYGTDPDEIAEALMEKLKTKISI